MQDLFSTPSQEKNYLEELAQFLQVDITQAGWPDKFGNNLSNFIEKNNIQKIRTLSLFSGAGGLDIGFSDAGFEIIESVEVEEKFCETLKLNSGPGKYFESSTVNCIDVRKFTSEHLGKIDFIIGGPPCQTFSAAGRRANGVLGTTDARGMLFKEYVRLLKELSPKGFLFENVYGIIGAQGGEPWKEILKSFSDVGYKLFYRILDAADYGVPQHRERLIIVGLKDGIFKFPRPTHGPDSEGNRPFYSAGNALQGLNLTAAEQKIGLGGRWGHLLNEIPPGLNYSYFTKEMGHPNPIFAWRSKFSDFLYKADPEVPVRTIKASGGAYTGPLHWNNRFFAYPEYKRLQTFPDAYSISGSKQIAVKQIGNSVPPQLARILALSIRQEVFKTQLPKSIDTLEDFEELSFRTRKRELTKLYQKKAKLAISKLPKEIESNSKGQNSRYTCDFTDNFDIINNPEGSYVVTIAWELEKLEIYVSNRNSRAKKAQACIRILPKNPTGWNLNVNEINLKSISQDELSYTLLWKALEKELSDKHIKADLVQLSGYYQYDSDIIVDVDLASTFKFKKVIESISSGINVGAILPTDYLATTWETSTTNVLLIAKHLRKLGFEIRNHNTNPQIEIDHWLIPYNFPTLKPLSVQLKKEL